MKVLDTHGAAIRGAARRNFLSAGCAALAWVLALETPVRSAEPDGKSNAPSLGRLVPIGHGWARNSVNAVIFRSHSVTTHQQWQYVSYYDAQGKVILARRELGSDDWKIHNTGFSGNTADAHNAISMAVDGKGYLHLAWDHHGHPLRYARSVRPGAFEFERQPMTGQRESRVTYPEFFNLTDGGLLALYRDGGSGRGDTLLNRYHPATRSWSVVQHPLISGEGDRNAYPNQIAIDARGRWHISWNWRETGDVASNHDLCYAVSDDEGGSWRKSTGERYELPITYATAEVVASVQQKSELINTCSTAVDSKGHPMIASYWRPAPDDVPQYMLTWHDGTQWRTSQITRRTTDFTLSGKGSRRLPMSRPQLAVDARDRIYMIFRDEERGHRISIATTRDPERKSWEFFDVNRNSVGLWEPSYDVQLWRRDGVLHLFKQRVGQGEGETLEDVPPQMVSILEWVPGR